jgi:hypothetical protein
MLHEFMVAHVADAGLPVSTGQGERQPGPAWLTRRPASLCSGAGTVTAAAFIAYQELENHVLNPLIMSRTVKVNPLLLLVSVLVGTSIGDWLGGVFAAFVAVLLSIPVAGALHCDQGSVAGDAPTARPSGDQ